MIKLFLVIIMIMVSDIKATESQCRGGLGLAHNAVVYCDVKNGLSAVSDNVGNGLSSATQWVSDNPEIVFLAASFVTLGYFMARNRIRTMFTKQKYSEREI